MGSSTDKPTVESQASDDAVAVIGAGQAGLAMGISFAARAVAS